MPSRSRKRNEKPKLEFHRKLILNQWCCRSFGFECLDKISPEMKQPVLGRVDNEGNTGYVKQWMLSYPETDRQLSNEQMTGYDTNIVMHLHNINKKRAANNEEEIRLKYFQWLALMFVEYYLDLYFSGGTGVLKLLKELNFCRDEFVVRNAGRYENNDVPKYAKSDLNKIAIWSATGSGKTHLMHINYLQYRHYGKLQDGASFILLTPNEGLSGQHIDEFAGAGINAEIYSKNNTRHGTEKNKIIVLENTKLEEKDGDKTVSVKRFGSRNVVFVDEGHRGSSSGAEGKWQYFRDKLCSEGFSFEYSATFGQAIKAANDEELANRYEKCILFDYSYKYFHEDGYGKDHNIINLNEDGDDEQKQLYLTACLLMFYQQKRIYKDETLDMKKYNIDNPLLVFVGAKVNAVRSECGNKVSDVLDIVLFLKRFIESREESFAAISKLLSGRSGLMDGENRDIFANAFDYLIGKNILRSDSVSESAQAGQSQKMFEDIIEAVFNSRTPGAILHIENLRGVSGEIQLRLGENPPFGIINIGDDTEFMKLCGKNGLNTSSIAYADSLFRQVTKADSPINILIGAKKFTEGWNCWRVSTMGLMNVGRSEGSEIIQLFGRGIRLKGSGMSLKRSRGSNVSGGSSGIGAGYVQQLETLNVFGIRANYMKQFKDFLAAEDLSETKQLMLPVIRNMPRRKLKVPQVKGNAVYETQAPKAVLGFDRRVGKVKLDCYAKLQFDTSAGKNTVSAKDSGKPLPDEATKLFDIDLLWTELVSYKRQTGKNALIVTRKAVVELLETHDWYTLTIPEDGLICRSFSDVKRLERIALSLMKKYVDKFYSVAQGNWENGVGYELVTLTEENFPEEYVISASISDDDILAGWIQNVDAELEKFKKSKAPLPDKLWAYRNLTILGVNRHLYYPLVYTQKGGIDLSVLPVALVESEYNFVRSLQAFLEKEENRHKYSEVYLLRNQSSSGVGFFKNKGFKPDFILWIVSESKQNVVFIEPHGMKFEDVASDKVGLVSEIRKYAVGDNYALDAFILSPTGFADMNSKAVGEEEWNEAHVLFMERENYIDMMFDMIMR